jgi:hypothetical protein
VTAHPHGPTFLVAGAARAGSTAVVEALRSHPDVFVTLPKEPHFFALGGTTPAFTGPGDDATINRESITDLDRYLALYPSDGRYLARGEGSVSTLYYAEQSIPAIEELAPDARIVIVLRDPVNRAFSSYQYLKVRGFEPEDDFLAAVDDEARRRELGWHHLWHYTGMSHYADDVKAFLEAFGDRVGVWFHDELESDPVTTITSIQAFIGVDPARSPITEVQRVNASGRAKVPALQSAIQWGGRQAAVRSTVKKIVPFSVREKIRGANLVPQGANPVIRQALLPRFADDLQRLEAVLARPVPATWKS